jgi:hypothetical protein
MTKVYIVTKGSYSDYSLVGVYSSKELAQADSDAYTGSNGVSEWELDTINPMVKQGFKYYRVQMQGNGDSSAYLEDPPERSREDRREFEYKDYKTGEREWLDEWELFCWAKDGRHAAKIANERRGAMIASGEWYSERQ